MYLRLKLLPMFPEDSAEAFLYQYKNSSSDLIFSDVARELQSLCLNYDECGNFFNVDNVKVSLSLTLAKGSVIFPILDEVSNFVFASGVLQVNFVISMTIQ